MKNGSLQKQVLDNSLQQFDRSSPEERWRLYELVKDRIDDGLYKPRYFSTARRFVRIVEKRMKIRKRNHPCPSLKNNSTNSLLPAIYGGMS